MQSFIAVVVYVLFCFVSIAFAIGPFFSFE